MSKRRPNRRDFLGDAGAMVLGSVVLPVLPATPREPTPAPWLRSAGKGAPPRPTLITIFLRGGNDALNTVIPWADKTYYEARPTIAIPSEATEEEPGVVKLNERYGLHPALAALKPFWDQGKLAAVLNVGSPHPTRSHFDAQDFMEYAAPGDRSVRDGWLNRFLRITQTGSDLRALAMQGLLPRSLRGHVPVLAVPRLRREDSEGLLDLFEGLYKAGVHPIDPAESMEASLGVVSGRTEAVAAGRHTIETLRHFWDVIDQEPTVGGGVEYPKEELGQRLRLLSRVIRNQAGLEIAAMDLTGWDHHQGEGSTDGLLDRRLRVVAQALAAFATDLGPCLDRVMVLVMTEFGRTVAENGNRGTDHGRGGLMLCLGGPVNGGRIYGDYGRLDTKHLEEGRDLRVEVDFRTVFQESLQGLFGFDPPKEFFPLWRLDEPLGLVKKS